MLRTQNTTFSRSPRTKGSSLNTFSTSIRTPSRAADNLAFTLGGDTSVQQARGLELGNLIRQKPPEQAHFQAFADARTHKPIPQPF